jgi:hypothetical protein
MYFNKVIPYRIYYGSQLELAYAVDILLVLDDKSLGMKHRRYHIEASDHKYYNLCHTRKKLS